METNAQPNDVIRMTVPEGYESLAKVLVAAVVQAALGKGAERHADGKPFDEQPMQRLLDLYGQGYAFGQAGKKMEESLRLPHKKALDELLGAIVYIAGAVIYLEAQHGNLES